MAVIRVGDKAKAARDPAGSFDFSLQLLFANFDLFPPNRPHHTPSYNARGIGKRLVD